MPTPKVIETWHAGIKKRDATMLDTLLAEDAVLYSPVLYTPQRGKALTQFYLAAALYVFVNDHFKYVREVYGERDAMLEFETELDGIYINGVDMIAWNEHDQITSFKVMLRPLQAVHKIHELMALMLENLKRSD